MEKKFNNGNMKRKFNRGDVYGDWELIEKVSHGGNGSVWTCRNKDDEQYAIKLLIKKKEQAHQRFQDEVTIIKSCQDIKGVVKIIDSSLPQVGSESPPFYVMPLGEPLVEVVKNYPFEKKIDVFIEITQIIVQLHARTIAHRDIKPLNFIVVNGKPVIIDFGLVDFPNKEDITGPKDRIGPRWTIAPEISRYPESNIDYLKSDIYSLAKTFWMVICGNERGFEGQYSTNQELNISEKKYTIPIDELLIESTSNDPSKRPTAQLFLEKLLLWKKKNNNYHGRVDDQWRYIQNVLFPVSIPDAAVWSSFKDILNVLKLISNIDQLNYVFKPNDGHNNLIDVKKSSEDGCIELIFPGVIDIVKPKKLSFESMSENLNGSFFRLETYSLAPLGPSDFNDNMEYLCERISTQEYLPIEMYNDIVDGEGYDHISRDDIRQVRRFFSGDFVIFSKSFRYTLMMKSDSHNKMSKENFNTYIRKLSIL
ncbi:protein kinase family protein [Saprospira grandis DSM 2844]|uniref:Protein kinase family protein n=1 Tax=Saprospira grandis DSM 2844 TaxID=694433 RepID=J1I327_9BACT|nr:protein kinase [Saprospira grandis]EJF52703.1 protein kinase family protein [Saprospira grandis DSM 2844]